MTSIIAQIREAVIAKAQRADTATLISMLDAVPEKNDELYLSDAELAELNERVRRYESGEARTYTWDEVLENIAQRRKNGNI